MSPADLIGIVPVSGLDGVNLPQNYARRALPVFQGAVGNGTYVPWIKVDGEDNFPKIPATILADAPRLKLQFAEAGTSWLGAFTAQAQTGASQQVAALTQSSGGSAQKALGIIDVGFAFWNERFFVNGACVFDDVGFMSLDGGDNIWLGQEGIQDLLRDTDPTFRNTIVRQALAEKFPQSIYAAKERGLPVNSQAGFYHGTAMADIAISDQAIPTFAMEMPSEALLDSSGDLLEAHLIPALRALSNRMMAHPDVGEETEKVILLAFGYPGGPHDGSRPIVEALKAQINCMNLTLVIPMGNHLQERCHARLALADGAISEPLVWVIPVEDYSANHVSLHYDGDRPEITLTDPYGTAVKWESRAARLVKIMGQGGHSDVVLGLAVDTPNPDGGGKVDLILTAVAGRADGCRAGRWSLRFAGGSGKIDAWISRDDMAVSNAVARRRKQSWFEDDNYQINGEFGRKAQTDNPLSAIKRAGTASALSTVAASINTVVVVGAGQVTFDGVMNADYSGLPYGGSTPDLEIVHGQIGASGILALGNGYATKFRVSGSSAAAAMRARRLLDA